MDLMRYQPTIGGSACATPAEAGCGSWKRGDGCHDIKHDSSKKRELSGEEEKQFLYESSRKSEISERELQQIFVKIIDGTDPNHKLSEREAESTRSLLDTWRMQGDLLVLPYEEYVKRVFISDEEFRKICKEAEAARKLEIAEKKQTGKPDVKPKLCEVCMKVGDHMSIRCPYLEDVPNPDTTVVGKGYEICCHHCLESDHGHPKGSWAGFAYKLSNDEECLDEDSESESDDEP
ncbi:PREDICTED: uncharacterized protein LOC101295145 [Fragaria vesca subsp. vesca]|uniref:uncharacterized protein LOC101295145 n=1 Tax=Fragaria vesca subsp. vesca TaxID=101020 RepID=UPI0002C330C5|nr:PREDICTED: uncharacterized protein LOC101295145 [Fragaria vesca subsp. vesca]